MPDHPPIDLRAVETAALDLLGLGGVSVAMLGGELLRRGLIANDATIGHAYAAARQVLDGMAERGTAQKWPCGTVYTIPAKAEPKRRAKQTDTPDDDED